MLTLYSESEPQFKLDIRNEPIHEEDGDAQSALSNVANTLRAVSFRAYFNSLNHTHTYIASTTGGYASQAYFKPRTERCTEYSIYTFAEYTRNPRDRRFINAIEFSF